MAQKKKKKLSNTQKVGISVGLTAAAVTAAGAYFLYGSKSAAKNRKKVKSWMLKARAEVLEALERAEDITEAEYNAIVEAVGGTYSALQNATTGEIREFKKEMKDHWSDIERSGAVKKIASAAQKVAKKKPTKKKATKKKTAKKTTKKKK
jgi:hypothetical protein